MKQIISLMFVILALLGIFDAGYLTYEKLTYSLPPCGSGFECGTVLTSKYASILGIPLSAYGLLYYCTILLLAGKHFLELEEPEKKLPAFEFLALISAAGLIFSGYLVFVMGVVLQAWCLYCLISASLSTLLFILVQVYRAKYYTHSLLLWKVLTQTTTGYLYTKVVKRILFLFSAESVHNAFTLFGTFLGSHAVSRALLQSVWSFSSPKLVTTQAGILFQNPIGLAAGFDYNGHLADATAALGFGWHTIGTVTLNAYEGNTPPRLDRFPKSQALLVNKGLKSDGARAVIARLAGKKFQIPVGISIASTNTHFDSTKAQIMDIVSCFKLFERSSVQHAYYELNISCPNTFGGEPFTTPARLKLLLTALDALKITKPKFVKMPIYQSRSETATLIETCSAHRVTGLIFGNLTKDKQNPAVEKSERALWANRAGNVSGRPTFERSLQCLKLAKQLTKDRFVLVGTGGIFTEDDAEKKLAAGADLVQLITGMIYEGPQVVGSIARELAKKR